MVKSSSGRAVRPSRPLHAAFPNLASDKEEREFVAVGKKRTLLPHPISVVLTGTRYHLVRSKYWGTNVYP
jgi:hypothetical protein